MISRRELLRGVLHSVVIAPAALRNDWARVVGDATASLASHSPEDVAQDEPFWDEIRRAFTLDRTIINLNNGGVSPSPRVVQEAMARDLAKSNETPAFSMWELLEPRVESVRRQLARSFGCDPEELAITRNASEALEIVQLGIPMAQGDEVLTTNQDYPRMLTTWEQRGRREGIVVRQISFPVPPPSMQDLVDRFERAIGPRTKVIHCCHMTNRTGQIFPVRDIVRMAKSRGIEVIVDGAQAYAHFPFQRNDLECDYYGTSLHKWSLAPHGTGFLYVRREKIRNIWPLMPAPPSMDANIRKFEEIGTHPAANHNAIAEALAFHERIGAERKAARLRYLNHRWMRRLESHPRIRLYTSFDPVMSCGLSLVGVEGLDPVAISDHLWRRRRILTTPVHHPEFSGIRITPNVYTRVQEVDAFAQAMEDILKRGIGT